MRPLSESAWNYVRNAAAVSTSLLSVVVIFFPSWYRPQHMMSVEGLLILSLLLGWYVEWRSGMLSLTIGGLRAEVQRRGLMAFGWVRPLPLLANVLFSVAGHAMSSRM